MTADPIYFILKGNILKFILKIKVIFWGGGFWPHVHGTSSLTWLRLENVNITFQVGMSALNLRHLNCSFV